MEEEEELIAAIADYVHENYQFKLVDDWIGVLTGQQEASFDWVAMQQSEKICRENGVDFPYVEMEENENYSQSGQQIGILDMGGSSTEISFTPTLPGANIDENTYESVVYDSVTEHLYSTSYEGMGHNSAFENHQRLLIERAYSVGDLSNSYYDPCIPSGVSFYSKVRSPAGQQILLEGLVPIYCTIRTKRKQEWEILLTVTLSSQVFLISLTVVHMITVG